MIGFSGLFDFLGHSASPRKERRRCVLNGRPVNGLVDNFYRYANLALQFLCSACVEYLLCFRQKLTGTLNHTPNQQHSLRQWQPFELPQHFIPGPSLAPFCEKGVCYLQSR
jgi:hypothetical protein